VTIPGEGASRVKAAVYCRISRASDGDTTKTSDQERICRELAERLGWDVVDVYSDESKSAWQANRKRRQWERMLGDVGSGRVNGIITYHGDRLVRAHDDLSALLKLAKSKGIRLASPTGSRDLDNHDDQFILEVECSVAKRESANISRRQKARYERDRRNGKVMAQGPGGRRFGYRSDGVTPYPADRCELESRLEVTELDVIREAARRVLAGESSNAIEADLRRRGWETPAGKMIQHGTLKRWLVNPRYAGLMPDGEQGAAWPAALERQEWERVRFVLEQRGAGYPRDRGNGARHLLSGIALCGAGGCGRPLMVAHVSSRGYKSVLYACDKRHGGCGKVWRNAEHLDAYVAARAVARLANPLNPEGRPPAQDHAAEWAILQRERDETDGLLADYSGSAGRARSLLARLDQIDARMAELREQAAGSGRTRLLAQYQGIALADFLALPLDVRRSLVVATVTVTVLPASARGPGFRTQDVRVPPA
jgi:DNA invertase Pin-like site-specific DNA recombinase